ncbi:ABC transporter ATP-binding protein [Pelagovum pacificum]|uniref:ABC transporter ATP-binding protein n=1 Tax=Pelagovum pacificum TaxID=2588711 RepID=A0A5C5GIT7_9RHOB|nr:ABC transporter ATP-binding protein [Pelagovum pacificum]QQA42795.1 ABC transporter ATP-binding protein [Pelagovum pacificum]TNY34057.1 ABC transporter ATP-binding protein [Pelagovum pacificum]
MNDLTPILDAHKVGVTFTVDGGKVEAVRDVSFKLYPGKTTALVGESGSGKSVTARAVMRLLSKRATVSNDTKIMYRDKDMAHLSLKEMRQLRGNRISMIFQEPMSSLNPIYKIGVQLVEVIMLHQRLGKKAAWNRAIELLDEVRIPNPEARVQQYPHQLSGGQRQRVMIAMALANRPDVLIADEPTTALDVTVQAEILHLIDDLKDKFGMGVVLITHDLTVVREFADHVYVMQHGEVREQGPTEQIFTNPTHAYTKRLLAAEPTGQANPLEGDQESVLTGEGVRVEFMLRKGGAFRGTYEPLIAVDSLDLDLKRGETLGLVGESGSGKTTFGQAMLRLIHMDDGRVTFLGDEIQNKTRKEMVPYRSRMQIVFQDPFASLNPRMSVRQIIEEGLVVNGIGNSRRERYERMKQALRDAGLPDTISHRFPHEFSGGQRQRLAIARAIALEPEFILLDEPTSALDLSVQAQIIELLRKLQREKGLSYLFISHDLKVVRALCHRVMVMQHGKIVEQGPVNEVLVNPKSDYTQRLVRAAFEIAT